MFVSVMTDIFYRMVENKQNLKNEMNALRNYTNESLESVSKSYNCKKYFINDKFILQ